MRSIITEKDAEKITDPQAKTEEVQEKIDDYLSQLVKFIPAEVVTFYTAIFVSARSVMSEIPYQSVTWLMFAMGLFATFVFSWATNKRQLKVSKIDAQGKPIAGKAGKIDIDGQIVKAVLSSIAFCIWAFTLGAPFEGTFSWYHPFYGTLLLTFYTLMTPKIYELLP